MDIYGERAQSSVAKIECFLFNPYSPLLSCVALESYLASLSLCFSPLKFEKQ